MSTKNEYATPEEAELWGIVERTNLKCCGRWETIEEWWVSDLHKIAETFEQAAESATEQIKK
jgi:hypothetical protein